MAVTKRAAVYVRVSTDRQTVQNQFVDLERLVQARGFEALIYEEVESAAKARPVLERLLADARAGRVHAVAVWALDRLHRSMLGAIQTVLELDRLGVRVISVRESWLDTDSPVRPLLVAIFGWVAEQERTRLIERTKAGMQRAKREGKKMGAPGPRRSCSTQPPTWWSAASRWPRRRGRRASLAPAFAGGWPKGRPRGAEETYRNTGPRRSPGGVADNVRFRPPL